MIDTTKHNNHTKSKDRIQKHGEVFTPAWVVNDMLNLFPEEVWEPQKTFLEPACGEGAFLVEILKRKLGRLKSENKQEWEWQAAICVSSLYGIELLEDNAEQCTMNIMRVFLKFYDKNFPDTQDDEIIKAIQFLISRNVIQGNALTYRKTDGELIIISEWTALEKQEFKRKDFTFEGIVTANEIKKKVENSLFVNLENETEHGLVKEYKPVNWKNIRYVTE